MTKTVDVSSINIKIGKKEIPLSLGEAKELRDLLNETFSEIGDKTIYIPDSPVREIACDGTSNIGWPNNLYSLTSNS